MVRLFHLSLLRNLTNYCTYLVLAYEPLRVSLEDLHTAKSKGKWWLVGAAWGGDPLVDRQETTKADEDADAGDMSNNTLLKLARKQGMNTDIRRSIFVVLMSSDVCSILLCCLLLFNIVSSRITSMRANDSHSSTSPKSSNER